MSREELYRGFQSVNGSYGVPLRNLEGGGYVPMETVQVHLKEVTIPFSFVSMD